MLRRRLHCRRDHTLLSVHQEWAKGKNVDIDEAVQKALVVLEQQKAHVIQLPRWVLEELLEIRAAVYHRAEFGAP